MKNFAQLSTFSQPLPCATEWMIPGWAPLGVYLTHAWKGPLLSHLLLRHVQEPHRVSVAVEEGSDCVQGFVELSLDVRKLFKDFASRPQQ